MAVCITADPTINDAANATKHSPVITEVICLFATAYLKSSKLFPAMIVGIESKNENFTASDGDHPKTFAHEMVDALLDIPGINAADCINPI